MKISQDIYYFLTYEAAKLYAETHELPTKRILEYELGWVIQKYQYGPHYGPKGWV